MHVMRPLALALVLLFSAPALLRADEWWAWSMLELWRQPPWTAGIFLGNRADAEEEFADAAALIPRPLLPRCGRRGERLPHSRPSTLTPSSSGQLAFQGRGAAVRYVCTEGARPG